MIFLIFGCSKDTNEEAQAPISNPFELGEWSVAADEGSFISRHGIEHGLYFWYPNMENGALDEDDRILYGEFLQGNVWEGGAPSCSQTRPVVMFSHGNTGMSFQSYFLMEHLASHGYIAVAPEHVGNTYGDNDESRKPELIFRRPEDVSDAFDWLINDSALKDCVDPDAGYAIIGHSFGGYTALALSGAEIDTDATMAHCEDFGGWLCDHVEQWVNDHGPGVYDRSDPRVWAGIPLTPAAYETLIGGLDLISVPQQVWGGELDDLTGVDEVVRPIYQELNSEKSMVIVNGAGHYSFTNACQIVSTYPDCSEPFLSTEEVHTVVGGFVTAFLAQQRELMGWEQYLTQTDDRLVWE